MSFSIDMQPDCSLWPVVSAQEIEFSFSQASLSQIPRPRAYLNLFHPHSYIVVNELPHLESGCVFKS